MEPSKSGSSGTQRLIRTACKAFHHRGSQQCGSSTLIRSYLQQKGIFKIPLSQLWGTVSTFYSTMQLVSIT